MIASYCKIAAYAAIELPDSEVPEILPTIGSPLQYGYRTKITPHFQLKSNGTPGDPFCIGFNDASRPRVVDIEVSGCPIYGLVIDLLLRNAP